MKLFLDANVIFSAAHREHGRAQALVALGKAGLCTLLTTAYALDEARRNLELKSQDFGIRLRASLEVVALVAEAPHSLVTWSRHQGLPPKDAPILASAIGARADLLVTGDARDFGHLYDLTARGTMVVTPARAIELVLARAGA